MVAIVGILVVFGAVVGGYLMEHGNLRVLLQPAELLIIGGAAAGTVLIANPLHMLKHRHATSSPVNTAIQPFLLIVLPADCAAQLRLKRTN